MKELFIFQNGFKLLVRWTFFANEKTTNCLCTANGCSSQQSKFNELAYTQLQRGDINLCVCLHLLCLNTLIQCSWNIGWNKNIEWYCTLRISAVQVPFAFLNFVGENGVPFTHVPHTTGKWEQFTEFVKRFLLVVKFCDDDSSTT